jgi:hypothetical protein
MQSKSANLKDDEKQYEKLKKGMSSPGLPALPAVPVPRTAAGRNRVRLQPKARWHHCAEERKPAPRGKDAAGKK